MVFTWGKAIINENVKQGSLQYTPEHCLVNGGFLLVWWKKPCFKWANVSFKEPCQTQLGGNVDPRNNISTQFIFIGGCPWVAPHPPANKLGLIKMGLTLCSSRLFLGRSSFLNHPRALISLPVYPLSSLYQSKGKKKGGCPFSDALRFLPKVQLVQVFLETHGVFRESGRRLSESVRGSMPTFTCSAL